MYLNTTVGCFATLDIQQYIKFMAVTSIHEYSIGVMKQSPNATTISDIVLPTMSEPSRI